MRTRQSSSSSDPVSSHRSVLLHEVIENLVLKSDDVVVDATLGGAGHSRAIAEHLGSAGVLIGIDADAAALERGATALHDSACTVHFLHGNFRELTNHLATLQQPTISKILFDLGWSAYQLDAGRGFSFLSDEPLAMTYAESTEGRLTAETIVNTWEESSLADVIWGWGEEQYARRIAKAIVDRRLEKPFTTARELADLVKEAVPPARRFGRLHPATKTFQALRIAVNDELGAVTDGLNAAWSHLVPHGRIAVITFHSIEDRLVKEWMKQKQEEGHDFISRKAIKPSETELEENPRARSAKLRVIEKLPITH